MISAGNVVDEDEDEDEDEILPVLMSSQMDLEPFLFLTCRLLSDRL
jgi:hypothetical protein